MAFLKFTGWHNSCEFRPALLDDITNEFLLLGHWLKFFGLFDLHQILFFLIFLEEVGFSGFTFGGFLLAGQFVFNIYGIILCLRWSLVGGKLCPFSRLYPWILRNFSIGFLFGRRIIDFRISTAHLIPFLLNKYKGDWKEKKDQGDSSNSWLLICFHLDN